jgi:phage/plasmid-like protein (TIGR03299 family)
MAHMIEIYEDGSASYVENRKREIAWHKLGQGFDRQLTVAEAIEGCRADYEVEPRRLSNLTEDQLAAVMAGQPITIDPAQLVDNWKAVTRNDNNGTLGVVKNRYEIVQNIKAFEFIDFLTTGELGQKASIECAGVLGKGERIFITAKFDESILIGGKKNDLLDMYAVFTNSFDGSSPVCCMITPIRVVCNNTLNMAFGSNTGRFNLRHTKSIHNKILVNEENMRNAASCLNILDKYTTEMNANIERLGNTKVTTDQVDKIIKEVLCPEPLLKTLRDNKYNINTKDFSTRFRNNVETIRSNVYNGIGQNVGQKNTGLWLINGFTTAFQNGLKETDSERKFSNMLSGTFYNKLNMAYDKLIAA